VSNPWGPAPHGPRRGPNINPRTLAWAIAGIALVVVLARAHTIHTEEVLLFCALIPSVILHEISHGALALVFGDDTAKRAGRLTLNPLPHIDPFGTIILPALLALSGAGVIGWAKPVPVNVSRLRHPRNENVAVALVGPAVNVVLAVILGLAWKFSVSQQIQAGFAPEPLWAQFLFIAGYVNVLLAAFNLIPLPPLDGSAVVERLLPARLLPGYYRIRPYTMFLPLLLVVFDRNALYTFFNWVANEWARVLGL
jgi:Zn-dependent protease